MTTLEKAYNGLVADQQTSVRLSRLAEGAISPGRVVTQGSTDIKVAQGGTGTILGISISDRTLSPDQAGDYMDGDTIGYVAHPAVIWCIAQAAVSAGDSVAYDTATGEVNLLGTAIPNAIFDSSAGAGELVKVRLV